MTEWARINNLYTNFNIVQLVALNVRTIYQKKRQAVFAGILNRERELLWIVVVADDLHFFS